MAPLYQVRVRGPLGQLLLGAPELVGPETPLDRVARVLAERWKLGGALAHEQEQAAQTLVLTRDPQGRQGLLLAGPRAYSTVTLGGLGVK
jgi:hypothetical protein